VTALVARLSVRESSTAAWSATASGGLIAAACEAPAPATASAAGRVPLAPAAGCAAALDGHRPNVPAAAAASARPDTANLTFLDFEGTDDVGGVDVLMDKMSLQSGAPARALGGHPLRRGSDRDQARAG